MADEIDQVSDRIDFESSISVANVCQLARGFDKGSPGDCDLCGENFERVIRVQYRGNTILSCGRCRDKHGIG